MFGYNKSYSVSSLILSLIHYGLVQALHHPFTAPNPEDMNDLASARALAYDMVYNGVEVIGIHFTYDSISCEPGDFAPEWLY